MLPPAQARGGPPPATPWPVHKILNQNHVPSDRTFPRPQCPSQRTRWIAWSQLTLLLALIAAPGLLAGSLTLESLRQDPKLTPQKFASYFSDFEFQYFVEVQPPEVFLASRKGDCDDYATLAFTLLNERGFHCHLVAVRMPGLVHVVCYIEELKGYLDFNNRVYLRKTTSSGPSIRTIASKVAKSFDASWTSASEFTFAGDLKYLVSTVTLTATYTGVKPDLAVIPPGQKPGFKPLPLDE